MSVRQTVLKISVTTELIGFYSSENKPTGPVLVLRYFLGGWDTPNPPPKKKKIPLNFFKKTKHQLFGAAPEAINSFF